MSEEPRVDDDPFLLALLLDEENPAVTDEAADALLRNAPKAAPAPFARDCWLS